jgi:ferric-dicitrate binding protein FerR (iron transport regulator)
MNCNKSKTEIQKSIAHRITLSEELKEHLNLCSECSSFYQEELVFTRKLTEKFQGLIISTPQIEKMIGFAKRPARLKWVFAVSSVALIIISIILMTIYKTFPQEERINRRKLTLSDGSFIIASPSCEVVIHPQKREAVVNQSGELYLKITQNPAQPFYLLTPAGTISVHGTEFSVSIKESLSGGQKLVSLLVFVHTGIVELIPLKRDKIRGEKGATLYTQIEIN